VHDDGGDGEDFSKPFLLRDEIGFPIFLRRERVDYLEYEKFESFQSMAGVSNSN
jgi:hypothetical protein